MNSEKSNYNKKIEQVDKLINQLEIRKGSREKLLLLYGRAFQKLYEILKMGEDVDYLVSMHTSESSMKEAGMNVGKATYVGHLYAQQNLVQEILDDFWAAYLCFLNGFTKQSQGILRNTVESIVQLLYLYSTDRTETYFSDRWIKGERGIEKIIDRLDEIKNTEIIKEGKYFHKLKTLYNLLCTATHSHQMRLMSINMPRINNSGDMTMIEPFEIAYTKGIFLTTLSLELHILQDFFGVVQDSLWTPQLILTFEDMLDALNEYNDIIEKFQKGYLIHREQASISNGNQFLYSIKIDGKIEFPGRSKPTFNEDQAKAFRKLYEKRLRSDT